MSLLLTICMGLAAISLVAQGLLVVLNDKRQKMNWTFLWMCFSLGAWVICNFLADADEGRSLLWSRLAFVSVTLACYYFLIFSLHFPNLSNPKLSQHYIKALKILLWLFIIIELTPWFITSVFMELGVSNVMTGPLYIIFPFYLVFVLGSGVAILVRKAQHSGEPYRTRAVLVLTGIVIMVFVGMITNLLLPSIQGTNSYANIGTLSTVIFVGFTTYAIIKKRLFDIRLIVARSLAYILLISTLTTLYFGMMLGLTVYLVPHSVVLVQQIAPLFAAVIIAATYPELKRRFDKLTNDVFYRDAYDPQSFLDELNQTVVTNIELGILLRRTAAVIEANLKCEFALFSIFDDDDNPRFLGSSGSGQNGRGLQFIREDLQGVKRKIVLTDDIESSRHSLGHTLKKNDIAVVVKLQSGFDQDQQARSYLILGPKKSGNMYNKQDIRILSIIADQLLIAIQNALRFEEIQNFNTTLQSSINDATAKMERTNKKLQDMDQTKDEFISMASHQLRTPLTSIKGYLSMVLEGDAGRVNNEQRKMLGQAYVSAQRMTYLISDLLNVSRLKTGKFVIELMPVNLAKVIEEEVEQLQETAKNRNLKFIYDKPQDFPTLQLDETKIRQVIMNFLDNAIYYTPSGGKIEVILSDQLKSVDLIIKDNGIGVPKHMQHKLFTKFYRADNAKRARPDGTGLGLFMAKKVVAAQGGAIIFRSEEGKGSTFGFSFPKEPKK